MTKGKFAAALLASSAMMSATQAWAQDKPQDSAGDQGGNVNEIIVYGQKGASGQRVQDVPVAITAVNSEVIAETNSVDLQDIGRLAPNTQLQPVSTFPGYANFTIRGIGVNNSVRTVDPAVNIVVDGMTLGFQVGTVLDTFDLESIEILRGPQGILFGRNTTGGAVYLRTARPIDRTRVRAEFTVGNYGRIDASASIEGPIGENIRAKLAVLTRNQDGYYKDNNGGTFVPAPGNPSGQQPANPAVDQVRNESIVLKPTITFEPSSNFDVTVFGQYLKENGGGMASRIRYPAVRQISGTLARDTYGYTPPADPNEINVNQGDHDIKAWHLIAESNLHLSHGVVTNVLAYRDIKYNASIDLDGSPFPLLEFPFNEEKGDQFSAELRYASDFSDHFDFVAGAFYFDQRFSVTERRQVNLTQFFEGDFTQKQSSWALFANANVHLGEKLTFTLGGRYTKERKSIDLRTVALCSSTIGWSGCNGIPLAGKKSWNDFSPKVGIQFEPNDDLLLYASWTRGFRSGNFFSRIVTTPATTVAAAAAQLGPVEPETVDAYEVGLKSTLADGRVVLNLAGFRSDYADIQRTIAIPGGAALQALQNAAAAKIYGIELETQIEPVDNLKFTANVGWTDAGFDSFVGRTNFKQLKFDRVPEWTLYLAGSYDIAAGSGTLTPRVSYSYRDHFFTDVNNTPELAQKSYGLLDASLTFKSDRNWSLSLFGRNLTKTDYIDVAIGSAYGNLAVGGAPRTWGLQFKIDID